MSKRSYPSEVLQELKSGLNNGRVYMDAEGYVFNYRSNTKFECRGRRLCYDSNGNLIKNGSRHCHASWDMNADGQWERTGTHIHPPDEDYNTKLFRADGPNSNVAARYVPPVPARNPTTAQTARQAASSAPPAASSPPPVPPQRTHNHPPIPVDPDLIQALVNLLFNLLHPDSE